MGLDAGSSTQGCQYMSTDTGKVQVVENAEGQRYAIVLVFNLVLIPKTMNGPFSWYAG